jgi:regulator of replication initiation timing
VERYFSYSEVNKLLKNQTPLPLTQGMTPQELKKMETNLKRFTTENKKLRESNKELNQKMQYLQNFYDTHVQSVQALQNDIQETQKWNTMLKIWIGISLLMIIFLFLAKITINIQF